MSYQVLARKWRPKFFRDVKGQEHITRTLINSIKNDKIAHAYLLTGTRGIGKTTIARIFAKAIKCQNLSQAGEPCLECESCRDIDSGQSLDYLEIDGASNNSVDDIRDLIENVQYLPAKGRYKVYVIDEVHMLSVNAFNALLKTLEEPPEHVIFIFATTDPQKLIGTVLSRCQRFDFKNSSTEETVNLIKEIAKSEGIEFESPSIAYELAKQGKGSFRDSLSLLDQVVSLSESKTITEESLLLSLGIAKTKSVNKTVESILNKDKDQLLSVYNDVLRENIDLKIFVLQVLDKFYYLITNIDSKGNFSEDFELDETILNNVSYIEVLWIYEMLSKDLEWAIASMDAEKACSFVMIKACLREDIIEQNNSKLKKKDKEKPSLKMTHTNTTNATQKQVERKETREHINSDEDQKKEKAELSQEQDKSWEGFIKYLYQHHKSLAINLERGNLINSSQLNSSEPDLDIAFSSDCKIFYDFLNDDLHKQELKKSIANFFNSDEQKVKVRFQILDDVEKEKTNFMSSVEIEQEQQRKESDKQRENILNNKYIVEAEKLFNTKIEKVILNKES